MFAPLFYIFTPSYRQQPEMFTKVTYLKTRLIGSFLVTLLALHCIKVSLFGVSIRSLFGVFMAPYFAVFGLNTQRYGVSLPIQSQCGKIRTRKTPNTDTFQAVLRWHGKPLAILDTLPVKFIH